MNRFEQVSSDGRQMSLAEGVTHVWKWGGDGRVGACTVRSNASWVMIT